MSRSGWLVAVAGVVVVFVGRLLGLADLYIFGAVLECLIAACLVWVLTSRPSLAVTRQVHPDRVTVGSNSRVVLTITNIGNRRSPVMSLRDPVSGTAGAEILLAPLDVGEQVGSTYHLPTAARGLLQVGPLDVFAMDPFGLTRLTRPQSPLVEVTVLPRIDHLEPPPDSTGDDPHGGAPRSHRAGRNGDEFHALRPYVVGDDLRRVHWASTARSGDLMVRHDETPWQGRTTVLVDLPTDPELLENTVSAAASVMVAAWRRGDLVRLLTAAGSDSGFGSSHAHLDAAIEHLALATSVPSGGFERIAHLLDHSSPGGLVAVLANPSPSELAVAADARSTFSTVTVVAFDPAASSDVVAAAPGQPLLLTVGGDQRFADVWNRTLGRNRSDRRTAYGLASAP